MSRCNALRHGLTAETVIDGLEVRATSGGEHGANEKVEGRRQLGHNPRPSKHRADHQRQPQYVAEDDSALRRSMSAPRALRQGAIDALFGPAQIEGQ